MSNQFADEEVASSYVYPKGYKVKGINKQGRILKSVFSGLGCPADGLVSGVLPNGAEGRFAIPRWEKLAPTYGEAVEKVLAGIETQRKGKFYNWHEGYLGPQYLRQTKRAVRFWKKLGEEQKGHDILIVPAQFGLRHRGRSIRRARAIMNVSEFGLGAFAVGIMLLTHPERLVDSGDLWIDCAGDEFSPDADGVFSYAPFFRFSGGGVEFRAGCVGLAFGFFGSASGFVSQ